MLTGLRFVTAENLPKLTSLMLELMVFVAILMEIYGQESPLGSRLLLQTVMRLE